MKKLLILVAFVFTAMSFTGNDNHKTMPPSEADQDWCYEYALIRARGKADLMKYLDESMMLV